MHYTIFSKKLSDVRTLAQLHDLYTEVSEELLMKKSEKIEAEKQKSSILKRIHYIKTNNIYLASSGHSKFYITNK